MTTVLLGESTGRGPTETTTSLLATWPTRTALLASAFDLPCTSIVADRALGLRELFFGHAGPAFEHGVRELAQEQLHGTHRVIVPGDRDVRFVRITVGIQDADHRDVHPGGLANRDLLATRVHDDDGARHAVEVTHTFEVPTDLSHLATHGRLILLLVVLDGTVRLEGFQLFESLEALADGVEVGEGPTNPTLRHGWHPTAGCLSLDDRAQLALGPEEHDLRPGAS